MNEQVLVMLQVARPDRMTWAEHHDAPATVHWRRPAGRPARPFPCRADRRRATEMQWEIRHVGLVTWGELVTGGMMAW